MPWSKLSQQQGSISPVAQAGWVKLNQQAASLGLPAAAGWTNLAQQTVTIQKETVPPSGWVALDMKTVTIPIGLIIPPDYKLVIERLYPDGETYSGLAQRCTASWTFLPSNFPGANWFTNTLFLNRLAYEVSAQGQKLLTMKLYEDGLNYLLVMEITNTTPEAYVALAPLALIAIIAGALAIIVIVIGIVIINTENFVYKAPGAAISSALILLGIVAAGVVGLAIWKGTSVKEAVAGKKSS